jgi:hypothetical protein
VETRQPLHLLPAPPPETADANGLPEPTGLQTDADLLIEKYRRQGEANKLRYGENPNLAPPPAAPKPPI